MEKITGVDYSAGKYIEKKWATENKDVNADVQNVMAEISDDLYSTDNDESLYLADDNLWSYEDGKENLINKKDYDNIFSKLSEDYGVDISKGNLDVLFDILDVNGDKTLSEDEYSFLMYKGGITGYSLIHALGTRDDNVADYVESNSSNIYKGAVFFSDSEEKESLLDRIKVIFGEDSEEYKEVNDAAENEKIKIDAKELSENEINDLAKKLKGKGDSSIKDYKIFLTKDCYDALESAIEKLKDAEAEKAESEKAEEPNVLTGYMDTESEKA